MEQLELPRNFGFNFCNFDSPMTYQSPLEPPILEKWKSDGSVVVVSNPRKLDIQEETVPAPECLSQGHAVDVRVNGRDPEGEVRNDRSGGGTERNTVGVMERSNDPLQLKSEDDVGVPNATEKESLFSDSVGKNQLEATLDWLDTNYERSDGVCLPRCVLYTHYLDLCKRRSFTPAGAATFGKIIRQRFPKITTRRLGTRGQSKYHYYGIGIKETSMYYQSVYSGRGLTRFSGTKVKTEGSSRKYSLSSKTGTLLPEFPKASDLILENDLEREKVETFIVMYRTHCQRILDTIINANFEEVQNFLLHFWQGMPEHLVDILEEQLITDLVGFCDSVLYKVLLDVLIPTTIQDIPDSLTAEIKVFMRRLPAWMNNSLEDAPEKLRRKKLEIVQHFARCMRRHISFVHLAQTSRGMLQCTDTTGHMLDDLEQVDFERVCLQVAYMQPELLHNTSDKINKYFEEFRSLLKKQSSIESFTEWIDNLVDVRVMEYSKVDRCRLKEEASTFILHWSLFSSFLLRDLTLHNAKTFGSFHLLYMTFNEYIFLIMETQQGKEREEEQKKYIQMFIRNPDDISTMVKARTESNSRTPATKAKRKRESQDQHEKDIEDKHRSKAVVPFPSSPVKFQDKDQCPNQSQLVAATAFSKPADISEISCNDIASSPRIPISTSHPSGSSSQPIIKPLAMAGGGTYSNTGSTNSGYLPHVQVGFGVGISAYPPEYLSPGTNTSSFNCLPSPIPRVQSQVEPLSQMNHTSTAAVQIPVQSCFSLAGNVSSSGSYWSDPGSRSHSGYPESYPNRSAKYNPTYENYGRAAGAFLRCGGYSESIQSGRSAFDPTRGFYSRGTESFPAGGISGGSVGMTTYGNNVNYMEVTTPSGQYGRQDSIFYNHQQEPHDLYSGYVPNTMPSINKSFMTQFR